MSERLILNRLTRLIWNLNCKVSYRGNAHLNLIVKFVCLFIYRPCECPTWSHGINKIAIIVDFVGQR